MTKLRKTLGTALALSLLLTMLPACERQEGPAERAGKSLDKAVEKTGAELEKAGQKIQDAAKGDTKK